MASPLDICNAALSKLGGRAIESLTQNIKEAKLCNARYAALRDEVLENGTWKFAQKRAQLAQLSTGPVYEWAYAYQLPADFLAVVSVENPSVKWDIEGDTLVTNNDTMRIKYIRREDNVSLFTPMFIEALAMRLAWDLAYPILQSGTQTDFHRSTYENYIKQARSKDSQAGSTDTFVDEYNDVFIGSRY